MQSYPYQSLSHSRYASWGQRGGTIKHVGVSRAAQRHLHADSHSYTRSRARLNSAQRGTSADLIPWPLREVFELQRSLTQISFFVRSKQDLVSLSLSFSRTSLDAGRGLSFSPPGIIVDMLCISEPPKTPDK
jgi:hypothetical protein